MENVKMEVEKMNENKLIGKDALLQGKEEEIS